MRSNPFTTDQDLSFINKLFESVKTIFTADKHQWNCEEILRFLSLLKIESKLETFFYEFSISGNLLFDLKYIWDKINTYIEKNTYFPIMKLMYIIKELNFMQKKDGVPINFSFKMKKNDNEKQQNKKQKTSDLKTTKLCGKDGLINSNKGQALMNNYFYQDETEDEFFDIVPSFISVSGEILEGLQKQFQQLSEINIIDLSTNQLTKIFKSIENARATELSQIIKKFSLDGYCLIYLFANKEILLDELKLIFSLEEIESFQQILHLLLPFYYKKIIEKPQKGNNNPYLKEVNFGFFQQQLTQTTRSSNDNQFSRKNSQLGSSQYVPSEVGMSEEGTSQFGTSQFDDEISAKKYQLAKSSFGRSEYGQSQYGQSELGQSEYGQSQQYASSEYAVSQRGSMGHSMAQSQLGESVVFDLDPRISKKKKNKDVRVSSVEDTNVIQKLKEAALQLPFNLFKMDPLQNIKITTLNYPFSLQFEKPKTHEQFIKNIKHSIDKLRLSSHNSSIISKQFNISGAKFGRSQQNDFRYPDELSISGKHAQIGFWDNKYQLVDLQSKTGTFLYVPLTRPLILKDQNIIQLSNEIQIIVHILKKDRGQGTIKLQFIKPQNQPFYKASLKQNQTLRIGSSQKSHIRLQQQSISSKHTQIKYQNQQFKIYDCLSSTGTWLRLSKKGVKSDLFLLEQGDIIRISSKKTYLIEKITNSFEEDDEYAQLQCQIENPNFKIYRDSSEDHFNEIIENAMKRKNPYEKSKENCYEAKKIV